MIITSLTLLLVAFIGGGFSGIIGVVAPAVGCIVACLFALIIVPVVMAIVENIQYRKALKNK